MEPISPPSPSRELALRNFISDLSAGERRTILQGLQELEPVSTPKPPERSVEAVKEVSERRAEEIGYTPLRPIFRDIRRQSIYGGRLDLTEEEPLRHIESTRDVSNL